MKKYAPFEIDPRLAGRTLAECKMILGNGDQHGQVSDKTALWHRQGGRCFYCDRPMTRAQRTGTQPFGHTITIDHVIARAEGGAGNGPKVGACYDCNVTRAAMPAHEFILVVARNHGIIEREIGA